MSKYFIYSDTPENGKDTEVAEEEFKSQVMNSDGRYYISFGDSVLECSKEEHISHAKNRNRHSYLNKTKKKIIVVSIEDIDPIYLSEDTIEEEIMEKAFLRMNLEKLRKALSLLSDYEQYLIQAYFFERMTQKKIGELLGKNQQTISNHINLCLAKLAELIDDM